MLPAPVWAVLRDQAFPPSAPSDALAALFPLLHPTDVEHIQKFRRPQDAQRCLLGRLLPRFLLATQYHISWSDIQFERTSTGRPFVKPIPGLVPSFCYSVSHDSNWVVMTWSTDHPVGIDVMKARIPWQGETVDQFIMGLADQLTASEKRWLSTCSSSATRLERVFALWTLKEAYTKALGLGLAFDFQRLEFRFPRSEGAEDELAQVEGFVDSVKLVDWSFQLLRPDGQHLVAVAENCPGVEGSDGQQLRSVRLDEMVAAASTQSLKPINSGIS